MDFYEEKKKMTPLRLTGQIIKWILISAVVLMIAWLTYRGIIQRGTKKVKNIVFTESISRLYEENGNLDITEHGEYNIAETDKIFYISKVYSIRQDNGLDQFQFMIRWNVNSDIPEDIGAEQSDFVFMLSDDCGNIYTDYEYVTDSKLMYRFIRLIFSDVTTVEPTELKLRVYPASNQPVAKQNFIDTCDVWFSDGYREKYSMSKQDRNNIKSDLKIMHGSVTVAGKEETK